MVYRRVRNDRPRYWQRNLRRNFGGWWYTHVPLAHAIAMLALGEIKVNMRFMVAVGTGTEDGGKTMARALA